VRAHPRLLDVDDVRADRLHHVVAETQALQDARREPLGHDIADPQSILGDLEAVAPADWPWFFIASYELRDDNNSLISSAVRGPVVVTFLDCRSPVIATRVLGPNTPSTLRPEKPSAFWICFLWSRVSPASVPGNERSSGCTGG